MAPAVRRYSYPKTLPSGSIRLLRLPASCPGARSDGSGTDLVLAPKSIQGQLQLTLEEYEAGTELSYRALSYTWGSAVEGEESKDQTNASSSAADMNSPSIFLGQEEHDVTPNLLDALRQCSRSFPGTLLWVDALCINQDDILERQIHVAQMDRVYSNASQVVLWLGLATAQIRRVLALVRMIAGIDAVEIGRGRHYDHPRGFAYIDQKIDKISDELWKGYLEFYERTWFQRGWVIQEAALARNALVMCGEEVTSWDILIGGSRILLKERMRKNFFASLKKQVTANDIDALSFGRNIWRMKLIQDACFNPNYRYLLVVGLCTGSYSLDTAEHVLIHIMRMARDFRWSDPRDRVYSVLGLVAHTTRKMGLRPLALSPDYNPKITPAEVLTKVAKAVIYRSSYLGIISLVSDPCFRVIPGLRSWVPDFYRQYNFAMGHISPLNACGAIRRPDLAFSLDEDTLHVQGKRMGAIECHRDICSLYDFSWHTLSDLMRLASRARHPEHADRIDVLWRTMIWDIGSHEDETELHPAAAPLEDSFLKWALLIFRSKEFSYTTGLNSNKNPCDSCSFFLLGPGDDADTKLANIRHAKVLPTTKKLRLSLSGTGEVHESIMSADSGTFFGLASGPTWMQQLFLSDSGYLGMGPKSGQPGDEVWIVNGCPFPMILRRNSDHFKVIGRSYIHGVMHGEALTDDVAWEDVVLL